MCIHSYLAIAYILQKYIKLIALITARKIHLSIITISLLQSSRLTVVSREAKKKQHACASSGPRDHYSELFTRMAALKF